MMTPPAMKSAYCTRILSPGEYSRLTTECGIPTEKVPDPDGSLVVVVEDNDTGKIIARWMAYSVVVLEGLEIAEPYRQRNGVAGRLWGTMMQALRGRGIGTVVTLIQSPVIESLAIHAEFTCLPGAVWQKDLRKGEGT